MTATPFSQDIMTILDMNLYNTLLEIENEKIKANIEPVHTLIFCDNLHDRVSQAIGLPVSHAELMASLAHLALEGRIHLGETSQDRYAKIIYKEIISSL